jgi:hypothetical protein
MGIGQNDLFHDRTGRDQTIPEALPTFRPPKLHEMQQRIYPGPDDILVRLQIG